ncbi:SDR family oxidoreductase [Actinomycetospora chiangmaiensis]|uniref:SDR family oxidoreductase n=1 Tax=Actinomycetospora chiangmaiensis TaxID=402650 RepID=UPI00035EAA44|nr:SDR family oxidoreductase [Actinomycetospora chiangmaiensis]
MTGRLDGTIAVVTGASSGIGAATARVLVAEGATVALLARRPDRLEALAAVLGDRAEVHPVDVADADAVRATIDTVVRDHGGLDVLVNNAGYGSMRRAARADFTEWRAMVDVNLVGVLAATHAALPHLLRAAAGPRGVADVVSVSSTAGRTVSGPGSNVYAATKHAVHAFSESLRLECASRHVRVALVAPGLVTTAMTDSGRRDAPDASTASPLGSLRPDDVADAIRHVLTRPPRVAVHELVLRPIEQVR